MCFYVIYTSRHVQNDMIKKVILEDCAGNDWIFFFFFIKCNAGG